MPRWLRGAPVAARAADRRLAAARGRNNSRVLALARLVLLLREARAVRRRHVLLQWPPTMRPHRHRQIQPRRPRRPRLRGCGHPDRRQPLAQPRIFLTESNVFARPAEWRAGAPVGQAAVRIFYRLSGTRTWTQRARNGLFGLFAAWHMAPGTLWNALGLLERSSGTFGVAPIRSLAQKLPYR